MKLLLNSIIVIAFLHCNLVLNAQCNNVIPPFSLGNDTTICEGTSLNLSPGNNFDIYTWDDGSNLPTRTVSQAGTYFVEVGVAGTNIILNGDFEAGNNYFSSDYIVGTGGAYGQLSTEGQYVISTSPSLAHTNFTPCGDQTSGTGNMLVANGSGVPNTNVWCQNVVVTPNTDYLFSCWITNALNGVNVANLQFYVNGSPIGSVFSTGTTGCVWENYNDTWNSGGLSNANICIVNQNTTNAGNDFAIDDIVFAPLCLDSDTIIVTTNPSPSISTGPTVSICAGETTQLDANSNTTNLDYIWTPGSVQGQSINVSPTVSTVYSVTAESMFGCISNIVSVPVVVDPGPSISLIIPNDTICLGENAEITASSDPNTTFEWNPVLNNTSSLIDTPLSTTTYSITATNINGCQNADSTVIVVLDPITIEITGDLQFCEGQSTTLIANGDHNDINYLWLPTSNNSNEQFIDESIKGWIYLHGTLHDCPAVIDSVFTESIQVPTIQVQNNFVICPGQNVTVTLISDIPNSNFVWNPNNLSGSSNTLAVDETTTYTVYAQNGICMSTPESFTIETTLICDLEVPNVFTPNGDFTNDVFGLISSNGIEALECEIINRWGNTIAQFDQADFKWNGTDNNGKQVSNGTYFYKIVAELADGEVLKKQGFVQLIR